MPFTPSLIPQWEDAMRTEGLAPASVYLYRRNVLRILDALPSPDALTDASAVRDACERHVAPSCVPMVLAAWSRWRAWAKVRGVEVAPLLPGGPLPDAALPVLRAGLKGRISWTALRKLRWASVAPGMQQCTVTPPVGSAFHASAADLGRLARVHHPEGEVQETWYLLSPDGMTAATVAQLRELASRGE